jgi:MraZ protein
MPRESTTGTIYAGEFHRTMDSKNRVTVPSEWLTGEGEEFFLLPGTTNLSVMPAGELARKEDELREMKLSGLALQEALRRIYGSARRIEPDKQGRILLPDEFCKKVELRGEVIFVGVKNRFEIWNPAKWSTADEQRPELSEEARQALEALGL